MTIEEAFGLVIRRLRKERSLSQEQLSLSSSLGRAFISQLERGKQQPTLVTIFELASALGVSPSRILTELELLLKYNSRAMLSRGEPCMTYDCWKDSLGENMLDRFREFKGSETILLADDESQLRDMLTQLLTEFGYTVIVAEDGQDAIEKFKKNRGAIRIILMDVVMPRKDGIKAYHEIMEQSPETQVILMSAYTADYLGNLRNFNFIQKPMAPLELIRKIRHILDGHFTPTSMAVA